MGSVTQAQDTLSQSLISDLGIRNMPLKVRDYHLPKNVFVFFFNGTEIKHTVNWLIDQVALSASFLRQILEFANFTMN